MESTREFTPESITELKENEVFVFGSNRGGKHYGGAAKFAHEKFGAEMGNPRGMQGKSYALPTLDENFGNLTYDEQIKEIKSFIEYAVAHPEKKFYLTKIGCGIAGIPVSDIRHCFKSAARECGYGNVMELPENIVFPQEFK